MRVLRWHSVVQQYAALTIGLTLVLLGAPIVFNDIPWLPDLHLWAASQITWPILLLTDGIVGMVYLVAGCLLLRDALAPWPRRWMRTAVWGLAGFCVFNLWLYVLVAFIIQPIKPGLSMATVTGLLALCILTWVDKRPLVGGSER